MFLPDDRLALVEALPQDQPRWEIYDNRNQLFYLAANLAVSPLPWLQIGGGAAFSSSTTGTIAISGQANIYTPDSSQLRSSVDADLTAMRYPQAGVRVALSDAVALALVYRGQFALDLDLKANIRGNISGLTTAYYDLQTDSVNSFLPQQVVLGGSWKLTPALRARPGPHLGELERVHPARRRRRRWRSTSPLRQGGGPRASRRRRPPLLRW